MELCGLRYYGDNCPSKRESLWADLASSAASFGGSPWLVIGDFNAIRRRNERLGGSTEWQSWMDDLDNYIVQSDLDDLRFSGQLYTWCNRREGDTIVRKLDRALVNMEGEG